MGNLHQRVVPYDVYATVKELTIDRVERSDSPLRAASLHGSSLLHPLPPQRSCAEMGIPIAYCRELPEPRPGCVAPLQPSPSLYSYYADLGDAVEPSSTPRLVPCRCGGSASPT